MRNAQYRLGNIYENGWGVAVDPKSAAKWYLRAAVQGMPTRSTTWESCI